VIDNGAGSDTVDHPMTVTVPAAVAAELRRLQAHSHAPYSGCRVSAAVEGGSGRIHYGVNVENAAYPQGACAETSAIGAAVTQGETAIRRVWVASSLPGFIWPCGGCRQRIWEFAEPGCEVVSVAADGAAERHTIEALLPLGFRLGPVR
jgi:cytidine deaminase